MGFFDDLIGSAPHLHGWQERGIKAGTIGNQQIAQALTQGEANPLFANLVSQEEQGIRAAGQSGIHELLLANNRAQARGLAPLLNPERRDEGIAQASNKMFEQSRETARQNVRNYLMSAANVNSMLMGGTTAPLAGTPMNPWLQAGIGGLQMALGQGGMLNGQQSARPGMASANPININFGQGQMGGYGWGGLPIGRS